MTVKGVEYNLDKSPYISRIYPNVELVFSSQYHLDKFEKKWAFESERLTKSLSERWKLCVDAKCLALVLLYAKIESRGFKITIGGRDIKCLGELIMRFELETEKLSNKSNDSTQK